MAKTAKRAKAGRTAATVKPSREQEEARRIARELATQRKIHGLTKALHGQIRRTDDRMERFAMELAGRLGMVLISRHELDLLNDRIRELQGRVAEQDAQIKILASKLDDRERQQVGV